MSSFSSILTKYEKIFNNLSNVTYDAYKNIPLNPTYPKYCNILYNKIISFDNSPKTERTILSKDDIKQQLSLIWYQGVNNFYKNKPQISLKQYLIRISIFRLRDYMKYELNIPLFVEKNINENADLLIPNFSLDLNFVLLGNNQEPWDLLYPHERYLLYLVYNKELSVLEIARKLHKDKDTIYKNLNQVLLKLKASLLELAA